MTSAFRQSMPPHRRRPAGPPPSMQRGAFPVRASVKRSHTTPIRRMVAFGLIGGLMLAAPSFARAQAPGLDEPARIAAETLGGSALPDDPRAACLVAAREAEADNHLPHGLLVSIALAESGLHAHAMNIGGRSYYPQSAAEARRLLVNGRRAGQSIMAGCVQVNARVHARSSDWPLDPRASTRWAAAKLRRHYEETGNWEKAIRRWNGGSPRVATNLVCRVRAKMDVVAPEENVLGRAACGGYSIARVRQDGVALLELAEAAER